MLNKCIPIIIVLLFITSLSIFAQPITIPGKPYTGLESSGFTRLTTHDELIAFLHDLDQRSKLLKVTSIGKSVEGRALPMAMLTRDKEFGANRSDKPVVFIFAQVSRDHLRILLDFGGRAFGDFLPVIQHHDPIRNIHHDFHVMLDEQYRDAIVPNLANRIHQR